MNKDSMKFKPFQRVLAITLMGVGIAQSENICARCHCAFETVPYFVDCSAKELDNVPFNININGENMTSQMTDLDLSNNQIEVLSPFDKDLNLHTLSLKSNRILEIKAGCFKTQLFLSYLDLSHNQLTSDMITREVFEGQYSPTEYKPMPLVMLDLSYNRITTLNRNAFDHLIHLEELKLDGNSFQTIDLSTEHALVSLVNLKFLSLADALLKTLPDNVFAGFAQLTRLNLSGNRFSDVPTAVRRSHHLVELNIASNRLSKLEADMFESLEHLEVLNVSYQNDLTEVGPKTFSPLKKLKSLFLQDNPKLDFIHPDIFEDHLTENFSLKHFYLNGNGLKYLPTGLMPSFNNWRNLESIDLEDNPWVCDCHNEWVFTALIDIIRRVSPTLVANIICQAPKALKGTPMVDLNLDPKNIECPSEDGFNVYAEHYGMSGKRRHFVDPGTHHHGHKILLALGLVVLVMVGSALVFGVFLIRKNRLTRYRSLHNISSDLPSSYSVSGRSQGDIIRSTLERNQDDVTIR